MSLFVLKLPARLDFKLIMSSLEELRQLIQPLFEGNQEAMQAHFQFLQANPSLTLNLNVQNILSLHATAKNSCLLLQREITMIGDSVLQIQDPELPSFLLTNLFQILQNISYKQYHRSISTSISRLARYYIPGGVWSEFFQFFFEIFATITTPDIQISFLDCLSQIVSLPEIDISQVIENIYNIIETFIVLDNPQIIEQTLQLLFSILKNKELYPQFESFVPIITSILTSGIELESQTIHIMRTISNFSQNGADYFTPDSENFINAILALAQSPSDKVRDFSIIVLPNLIGTFAQELKENIPDIFALLFQLLVVDPVTADDEPYNAIEDAIHEIARIYDSDPDVDGPIVDFLMEVEVESPEQLITILICFRIIYHYFSSILLGQFSDILLPFISQAISEEDEEGNLRYQGYYLLKKSLNDDSIELEERNQLLSQVLEAIPEETVEKCLRMEIKVVGSFVKNFQCEEHLEEIIGAIAPLIESAPNIIIPLVSTIAKHSQQKFQPFVDDFLTFLSPIIEGYEEHFQTDEGKELVFNSCLAFTSFTYCVTPEQQESIIQFLLQFIFSIDPESFESHERDSLNQIYAFLINMQNKSPSVQETFGNLAEKIFEAASKELKFETKSVDDYENGAGDVAELSSDGTEYRIYESSTINEAIEAAVALQNLLSTSIPHPEFVERVASIIMAWCQHTVSPSFIREIITVAAYLMKHIDWQNPALFVQVYKAVTTLIQHIDLRNECNTFYDLISPLSALIYEYSRKIDADPEILQIMCNIESEGFGLFQKMLEKNDAGDMAESMNDLSDFLAEFLVVEYAVLKFHPELVEIVLPLNEILPISHENFSSFTAGLVHFVYLLQTTPALDAEIPQFVMQFFESSTKSAFKQKYSMAGILGLLSLGKFPQEALEQAFSFLNEEIAKIQTKKLYGYPPVVSALLKCAEVFEDASPFVNWTQSIITKYRYSDFWTIEVVESLARLIQSQKPPFNTPLVIQAFIPFIQNCLDKNQYIIETPAIQALISQLTQQE